MAVVVGYQASVAAWAAGTGGISNAAMLALSTYNAIDLNVSSNYLDTTRFGSAGGIAAGVAQGFNGLREWSGTIRGMNATPVPGHVGLVAVTNGYAVNCYSWMLSLRGKELDVTAFQPSGDWKAYSPGIVDWGGEYAAWVDSATAIVMPNLYGTPVIPTFTLISGNTLSGNAHITNVRIGVQVEDRQLVTFSYQGTGNLTSVGSTNVIPADTTLAPFGASQLEMQVATSRTLIGDAFPTSVMVRCVTGQRTETEIGFRGTGVLTAV